MDYQKIVESIIKKAKKAGVDEAETYMRLTRSFTLSVRNGEIETLKQSTTRGIGLTVYKDKKLGFSYTSDFSPGPLEDFIKKTVNSSLMADPKPWNGLPGLKEEKLKDLDLFDSSLAELEGRKKIEIAKKTEKIALAYDKRIKNTSGGRFSDSETEIIIANTEGIVRRQKTSNVSFGAGVIAGEGNNMQSGYWSSSKRHFKDLEAVEEVAKKTGKRAVRKLGAKPVKTQKVPAVFDRDVASRFWGGVLSAFDGDMVFKKATFLTDALGQQIASGNITLIDDPTISRHVASTPFDGEGKITRKNTIIDKGVLKMFIYNTLTARKAGVKVPTMANRRGYKSTASGGYLNVIVQNGDQNLEKMIGGIKNGFYVTGLRGSGTNVPTGNFSVGASGFWITDGEIAFPVDGVTLGGKTLDLLKNIELMADDLEIRGRLNSPSFKVAEIAVGGRRG